MTEERINGRQIQVAKWSELEDRKPAYALVGNVDLVVVRFDDQVSVLYGRCQHRGVNNRPSDWGADRRYALYSDLPIASLSLEISTQLAASKCVGFARNGKPGRR